MIVLSVKVQERSAIMPRAKTMAEIGAQIDGAELAALPETDTPGVMPPAGTKARVRTTIDYESRVDPEAEHRSLYGRELQYLAAEESERLAPPSDPLAEWLEIWANHTGYNCWVIRMPDPSTRRPPSGTPYARPNYGPPEQLGAVTFDPSPINFVAMLQMINGNSGGVFQIWLIDPANRQIPDSVLYNVAVADPPKSQQTQNAQPASQPQVIRHEKSDAEKRMDRITEKLLENALERAINPPPTQTIAAGSGLTGEQQAALFLFQQTDFLGSLFGKMKEMSAVSVPEAVTPATWKERGIEAFVGLAESNPAIVERLSNTLERIVARILPDPIAPQQQAPVYYQQAPQYLPPPPPAQPQPQPQPASPVAASTAPVDPSQDPEIMTILDEFIALLNSDEVLHKNHPVFIKLSKAYPPKFKGAVRMIARSDLDSIIEWVGAQNPLYESLLTSPRTGAFLHERIAELQRVFQEALNVKPEAAKPEEQDPPIEQDLNS